MWRRQVMNTMMGRARRQVAEEVVEAIRHPRGYVEGMRQENLQKDQMDGISRQGGGK